VIVVASLAAMKRYWPFPKPLTIVTMSPTSSFGAVVGLIFASSKPLAGTVRFSPPTVNVAVFAVMTSVAAL